MLMGRSHLPSSKNTVVHLIKMARSEPACIPLGPWNLASVDETVRAGRPVADMVDMLPKRTQRVALICFTELLIPADSRPLAELSDVVQGRFDQIQLLSNRIRSLIIRFAYEWVVRAD